MWTNGTAMWNNGTVMWNFGTAVWNSGTLELGGRRVTDFLNSRGDSEFLRCFLVERLYYILHILLLGTPYIARNL
jgi:hypothetical protein